MPALLKEQALLWQDILHILENGQQLQIFQIMEKLKLAGWSNIADHVVAHATKTLYQQGKLTRWKEGKGFAYCLVKDKLGATQPIESIAPAPAMIEPSLMELNITVTREPPAISFLLNGVRITVNVP